MHKKNFGSRLTFILPLIFLNDLYYYQKRQTIFHFFSFQLHISISFTLVEINNVDHQHTSFTVLLESSFASRGSDLELTISNLLPHKMLSGHQIVFLYHKRHFDILHSTRFFPPVLNIHINIVFPFFLLT